MSISKTTDHIWIKIKMPNPSQEPPASSKASNQDLQDMDVLCTFKIKIESQNSKMGLPKTSEYIRIKIKRLNPSQEYPVFQIPKSGLKGHGRSLPHQIEDGESKFGIWVYQRPVTISKSRSRCKTPVRNLQHPPKPQIRTLRTWMFVASSKSR